MKKVLVISVLCFLAGQLWAQEELVPKTIPASQENRNFRIPLIGETAPSFVAESTNGVIHFPSDFGKSWKILFSHPQDFTPVCSSELLELANLQQEFNRIGAKLVVISTDPVEEHNQWKKALEEISYKGRLPEKIKFPLVDDDKLVVAKMYGMIHPSTNTTRDVRGVFIIDPDDIIRAIYFYPMNVGRNTSELIRTITALSSTKPGLTATPADWKSGDDLIVTVPPTEEMNDPSKIPDGYYNLAWFMWFKKAGEK